jgi:hypothetical protein
MNKKHLYKALCLLAVLTVHPADAAFLQNPVGPGYDVFDNCIGCPGLTALEVNILANDIPIVLDFDPLNSPFEDFDLMFNNLTGSDWASFSIEYVISDPFAPVHLGLQVLGAGTSAPLITSILTNPNTGLVSGMELSLLPPESFWLHIIGIGDRPPGTESLRYSLVITTSAVPVTAAVWLFGSGLIGLVGMARRKKA